MEPNAMPWEVGGRSHQSVLKRIYAHPSVSLTQRCVSRHLAAQV